MPSTFTPGEYVDMMLIYGECRRNRRLAEIRYRERYPDRQAPSAKTFVYAESKLRTGVFPSQSKHQNHAAPAKSEENVINVLAYVSVYPHSSSRLIAAELGISKSTVHRILKENRYHPFKLHLIHSLRPIDHDRRLEFIALMQVQFNDNPQLLNRILWSDESRFHNNGVVNRHNCHYWSVENPRWARETHFQNIWGINVWCGLFNAKVIGPFFYEGTLTGQRYYNFLSESIPELLEDVPLEQRASMWWQQDGAPPHNCAIVTEFLNEAYGESWIGNKGPLRWPARSPDLTPLDFFFWGYVKELVYKVQITSLEHLKERITQACQSITPAMIQASCTRELIKRFGACVEAGGGQFEHLLKK